MTTGSYSSKSAAGTFLTSVPTLVVSLVFVIGLIVLVALHDVTGAVAIPLMSVIGGVHTGAAVSS